MSANASSSVDDAVALRHDLRLKIEEIHERRQDGATGDPPADPVHPGPRHESPACGGPVTNGDQRFQQVPRAPARPDRACCRGEERIDRPPGRRPGRRAPHRAARGRAVARAPTGSSRRARSGLDLDRGRLRDHPGDARHASARAHGRRRRAPTGTRSWHLRRDRGGVLERARRSQVEGLRGRRNVYNAHLSAYGSPRGGHGRRRSSATSARRATRPLPTTTSSGTRVTAARSIPMST